MTATNKKDDYFETLTKCQMKLVEINHKLHQIKKRHCKMDELFPNKGGRKQKARLEENYSLLKKEAELLERDIAFVSSLMECGCEANRSFTARIMKKVLPGRMFYTFGRETSKELKVSIMSHSTKFLEEKVISLESLTKRSKQKKIEDKKVNRAIAKPTNKSGASSSSSKSIIKIENKTSELEEELSQNSKQFNAEYENDHVVFSNDICTDNSGITFDNVKKPKIKRKKRKRTGNERESTEKFAQTENIGCCQRSSSIESLEKCIQTDEFKVSYMNPEICAALKKVLDECILREHSHLNGEDPYDDSVSYDLSESSKELNQSGEKTLDLFSEWKESVLPSLMHYFQNKNTYSLNTLLDLEANELTRLMDEIKRYPRVNHVSTQIFSNPIGYIYSEGRRKVTRVSCLQSQNVCLPEIWLVKECVNALSILQYDFTHQDIPELRNLSSTSNGVLVQVTRKQSAHEPLRNTLEIDYCHNANTSGRIVLTEVGSEQCLTQTEIFGRIVTYLLGLKTPTDNT